MTHGTPDWGVTSGAVTVYQLTDLAELAARLGSPVTFDRRGDVLYLEQFESGLSAWASGVHGTGATVDLSSARSRYGRYSARMVAGSDDTPYAQIYRYFPYPVLSRMGVELGINLATPFSYVEIRHDVFDGANWLQFRLRYHYGSWALQYQDGSGAWVTFATTRTLAGSLYQFSDMKLVSDPAAGEYVRCVVNSASYSLAGVGAYSTPLVAAPSRLLDIYLYGVEAENDVLYLDDVILTQNEP